MNDNRACYQMTEWGHPREKVKTVNGYMDYELWLQNEVNRNAQKWRETWLEVNKEGCVAMFCWANETLVIEGEDPK